MYSKFFIYSVIICTIPLILMDIAFIYSMLTGGYEGNLKATILAVIVFHILLYVNVNIRMYNFDDVQCTVIPSVAYGFVTGMNLQLC